MPTTATDSSTQDGLTHSSRWPSFDILIFNEEKQYQHLGLKQQRKVKFSFSVLAMNNLSVFSDGEV